GGEKEVFLGGSRLNRFMETFEKATTAIPAAFVEERGEAARAAEQIDGESGAAEAVAKPSAAVALPSPAADPWTGLLQTGVALLQQLTIASRPAAPAGQAAGSGGPGLAFVARDEQTGETYLKLPVPKPEVLEQALKAFSTLLE